MFFCLAYCHRGWSRLLRREAVDWPLASAHGEAPWSYFFVPIRNGTRVAPDSTWTQKGARKLERVLIFLIYIYICIILIDCVLNIGCTKLPIIVFSYVILTQLVDT